MNHLKLFEGLTTSEKRVITSTFFFILFLLLFVNVYDFSTFSNNENQIGRIQELTNNTRVKSHKRVLWQSAKKRQSVNVGDKVFTGQRSAATIQLGKQGSFSLGENSLVEFQIINKEKLANFKNGTYRLFSNGKLRIALNGTVTEIDAESSEFEIVVNGTNDLKIKTIKGSGKVTFNNQTTQLSPRVATKQLMPVVEHAQAPYKKDFQFKDIPSFKVVYFPKLYDEYKRTNGVLENKQNELMIVNHTVRLPLPTTHLSETVHLQHSNTDRFTSNYDHKTFGFDKKIKTVFIGTNFWRYKLNDSMWSNTHSFEVIKTYPNHSKPELHFSKSTLFLTASDVEGVFNISTPHNTLGFIIETSRSGDFSKSTNISWQKSRTVTIKIKTTGSLFFRARSVDPQFRLSDWSEIHSFNTTLPPALEPIQLKVSSKSIRLGESIYAQWQSQTTIKNYKFHVTRGLKQVVSVPLKSTSSDWFPQTTGTFQLSVTATDEFGRPVRSNTEDILVAEPFVLTKLDSPKRDLSSEVAGPLPDDSDTMSVSVRADLSPKARNRLYTRSFLTVATSHIALQSKPLSEASGTFSNSAALSVDYLKWYKRHGLEGLLLKSVVPLSSGVEASDLLIGEARYRYRFTPYEASSFLRSFQLSGFLGYEFYKNSKDTFFISEYNFYKAGIALDIPLFDRFVMSGLAAYGTQSSSTKYETSWDLFYFLQSHMGFGFGYKLNFVSFDLTEEFPGFSPYREGFAQGTLSFKYFF